MKINTFVVISVFRRKNFGSDAILSTHKWHIPLWYFLVPNHCFDRQPSWIQKNFSIQTVVFSLKYFVVKHMPIRALIRRHFECRLAKTECARQMHSHTPTHAHAHAVLKLQMISMRRFLHFFMVLEKLFKSNGTKENNDAQYTSTV